MWVAVSQTHLVKIFDLPYLQWNVIAFASECRFCSCRITRNIFLHKVKELIATAFGGFLSFPTIPISKIRNCSVRAWHPDEMAGTEYRWQRQVGGSLFASRGLNSSGYGFGGFDGRPFNGSGNGPSRYKGPCRSGFDAVGKERRQQEWKKGCGKDCGELHGGDVSLW